MRCLLSDNFCPWYEWLFSRRFLDGHSWPTLRSSTMGLYNYSTQVNTFSMYCLWKAYSVLSTHKSHWCCTKGNSTRQTCRVTVRGNMKLNSWVFFYLYIWFEGIRGNYIPTVKFAIRCNHSPTLHYTHSGQYSWCPIEYNDWKGDKFTK